MVKYFVKIERFFMAKDITDVLIIGAGASGLAAGFAAADRGLSVRILERGIEPAKKIYATGNGRCNYSNLDAEHSEEVIDAMRSCFGIEPAEEYGRIYPRNFEAASVAHALIAAAERVGAEIICDAHAAAVQKNAQGFVVKCDDGREFAAEKLILATGGKAGIQYGCTGDGYKFAEALGHSIIKPIPALDGLCCAEDIEALHGVRVSAVAALEMSSASDGNVRLAEDMGEVQFTKNGISGICVMNLSRCLRLKEGTTFRLVLDLFPEMDTEDLTELFFNRKQRFGCGLSWLLPEKLKDYMHTRLSSDLKGPAGMAQIAKNLSFTITGSRGWKTAQVTCGGVPLSELDAQTFESKLVPGLFITGELMDYDGPCGGFNLNHAIWSGLTAGRSV